MSIEYFGEGPRLLGAIHHPQRGRARSTAALLCNPFGEEATRAHRTYRVLATQLERAGYAAMRFDFSCTGDSSGEAAAASVEAWLADVATAAARLRAASGAEHVALIGLRLGATLAALASSRGDVRPQHLVLWDPVVSGRAYLTELAAQHRAYLRAELGADPAAPLRVRADGSPLEALGTPISDELAAALARIELAAPPVASGLRAGHVTVIATQITPDLARLRPALPASAHWRELTASAAWGSDAALNAMTVPMEIVQAIVARLEETAP